MRDLNGLQVLNYDGRVLSQVRNLPTSPPFHDLSRTFSHLLSHVLNYDGRVVSQPKFAATRPSMTFSHLLSPSLPFSRRSPNSRRCAPTPSPL